MFLPLAYLLNANHKKPLNASLKDLISKAYGVLFSPRYAFLVKIGRESEL
jgi:hypothetical protein